MHPLIEKLLFKRKIKDFEELDKDEKETFESWQKVLTTDELTVENIKDFCRYQIDVIEGKWKDLEKTNVMKAELIPYHTVYKVLLLAIDSPKATREALEKNLNQMIQQ